MSAAPHPDATIHTLAGNGERGNTGDGEHGTIAALNRPRSVSATADGSLLWAEPYANRVRKLGSNGLVQTVAGNGAAGFGGDGGPATAAMLNFVHGASPTPDGGFVVADSHNNRIRKVAPDGIITTVVGTGAAGFGGDSGPATAAQINNPRGVASLSDGSLLIPDSDNHRVRRVAPTGVITTVAGNGVPGFSGDGGPATSAQLSVPFGVAPTPEGGFLIVDVGNQRIRKVSASGIISTVAGAGSRGYGGDGGPATRALLADPHNIAVTPDGGFVIADATNQRIRHVDAAGTITTVAGTGARGYDADGQRAVGARLAVPKAVDVLPSGAIVVADEENDRIRFIGVPTAPTAALPVPTISGIAHQGRRLTASTGGLTGTGPMISYEWQRCAPADTQCAAIPGATSKTLVIGPADAGATIRVQITARNAAGAVAVVSSPTSIVGIPLQPPINASPPAVIGGLHDGLTLTATPGTWTGTPPITYAHQWQRCDATGAGCVSIAGATDRSYVLSSVDVGSTIRVVVTASNASPSGYEEAVLADGASAYWRFAETDGALVDHAGRADGTYVGGLRRGVTGLLAGDPDRAVSLSGSRQYLEVSTFPSPGSGKFSIEILVRPSVVPDNRTIWSATDADFTGWWLNTGATGVPRIFIGDGSRWRRDQSAPPLIADRIYHLVATYDGVNARLYVNGALASTGPAVTMAPMSPGTMRFGAASPRPRQYWPGILDDASFYPYALSAAQVQAHHAATLAGRSATSAATGVVTATRPAIPESSAGPVRAGEAPSSRRSAR